MRRLLIFYLKALFEKVCQELNFAISVFFCKSLAHYLSLRSFIIKHLIKISKTSLQGPASNSEQHEKLGFLCQSLSFPNQPDALKTKHRFFEMNFSLITFKYSVTNVFIYIVLKNYMAKNVCDRAFEGN